MKRILLLLLLLVVAAPAMAADITVKNQSDAIVTLTDNSTIRMRFTVASDGSISWIGALGRDQWFAPAVNGGISPTPPPPTPVPPEPLPPTPVPTPSKVRVALFVDNAALNELSESQRQMMASCLAGSLRDWCAKNCLAGPDGSPEMRIWPSNTSASDADARWQPIVAASTGKPGIVVQAGEAGPITRIELPKDSAAAIDALERLAGLRALPPPKQTALRRHVIDNKNFAEVLNVRPTGYIRGTAPSRLPTFRASYPLIPRSQWSALITEGKGTFLGDLMRAAKIPAKDQDGTNYCWAYASVSSAEAIRALQGQPYVNLSPESVGGPVKSWRNVGGWGQEALEQLTNVGACRMDFMNSANSLSPRKWKDGWEADCANHKITASWANIDDGDFDAVMTAALLRLPVSIGLDWWGHQVLITGPVDLGNGNYGVEFRNSWGSDYGEDGFDVLTESKAKPSGSFACVSVGIGDRDANATKRGTPVDLVRLRHKSVERVIQQYQLAN